MDLPDKDKRPKKVEILLSTYNGGRYLEQLLESLAAQDHCDLSISVRDDGSTDSTASILDRYAKSGGLPGHIGFKVKYGKNIGFISSFFNLLSDSAADAEYFAFCDQDDVWKSGKISAAVEQLERYPQSIPLLYCSRLEHVDRDLCHIRYSDIPPRPLLFGNALVENVASGCTVVMNRTARDILTKKLPTMALSHDWWCYMAVSAMGRVIFDDRPLILYRIHGTNTISMETGALQMWKFRILRFYRHRKPHAISDQASEFREIFKGSLPDESIRMIDKLAGTRSNILNRMIYLLKGKTYRQKTVDNLIFKLLILAGTL